MEVRQVIGRPLRFAILGAGMAGLLAAVRLREDGDEDFAIFEKGDKVGGTWRFKKDDIDRWIEERKAQPALDTTSERQSLISAPAKARSDQRQ